MKATLSTEHSRFIDSDNAYYTVTITLPDDLEGQVIEGGFRMIISSHSCYPDDDLIEACEKVGIDEYDLQDALEKNRATVDIQNTECLIRTSHSKPEPSKDGSVTASYSSAGSYLTPIPQKIFDVVVNFYKAKEHAVHRFALKDLFSFLVKGVAFNGESNCSVLIKAYADKEAYPHIGYTVFNSEQICLMENVFVAPYEVLDFIVHGTNLEDIPGLCLNPSLANVNTGTRGKIVLDVNYTLQSLIDSNKTIGDVLDMVADNLCEHIEEGVVLSEPEGLLETCIDNPYHVFKCSNPANLDRLDAVISGKTSGLSQPPKEDASYKIPSAKAFKRLVKGMKEDFAKEGIDIGHAKLLNIVSKRIYGKPYEEVKATVLK